MHDDINLQPKIPQPYLVFFQQFLSPITYHIIFCSADYSHIAFGILSLSICNVAVGVCACARVCVSDSCQLGWRLLTLLTSYSQCSDALGPYLIAFLEQTSNDERRANYSQ